MSHYRYDQQPSTTQKRTRANSFDGSRAPPLPTIETDHVLEVFTHKSLRRPGTSPSQYPDNERLAYLGQSALNAAVVEVLLSHYPQLHGSDAEAGAQHLLDKPRNVVEDWVIHYKLRERTTRYPAVHASSWTTEESRTIFYAYTGAVFLKHGQSGVKDWINKLLEQENLASLKEESESEWSANSIVQVPPSKRPKSEATSPPPLFVASQPPRSSTIRPPPPHLPLTPAAPPRPSVPAARPSMPNPLAPAQPSLPFLPLFNQTASQRRVTVEYPAELSGPPQAVRWTVKCVVNGICKGQGVGSSKSAAKEEAARAAYYAMGWT